MTTKCPSELSTGCFRILRRLLLAHLAQRSDVDTAGTLGSEKPCRERLLQAMQCLFDRWRFIVGVLSMQFFAWICLEYDIERWIENTKLARLAICG